MNTDEISYLEICLITKHLNRMLVAACLFVYENEIFCQDLLAHTHSEYIVISRGTAFRIPPPQLFILKKNNHFKNNINCTILFPPARLGGKGV